MDAPRVSEADAARIWERASELQARAMHQLESRARELREERGVSQGDDHDVGGPDIPPALADGFALEEVRSAAQEAGISPDFVDRALAELRHEQHGLSEPPGFVDRLADSLLEAPTGSLVVRRRVEGDGQTLLAALNHVLVGPGYGLRLVELEGDDPLDGATMVFKVPGFTGSSGVDFAYRAAWLWVDTLMVTVRSDPSDEADPAGDGGRKGWEVELLMPLRKGRRVNAWGSVFTSGTTGLVGGFLGAAAGFGVATGLALPGLVAAGAMAALGIGGVGGGGWGGVALYRLGWRHGAREMTRTLEETLRQVALHTRTGGSFQIRPSDHPPGTPGASGGGGSDLPSWLLPGIS